MALPTQVQQIRPGIPLMSTFVKFKAVIDKIDQEITRYETVAGAQINCDKFVGLWLVRRKEPHFPDTSLERLNLSGYLACGLPPTSIDWMSKK